jgi:hypothetical protein
MRLGHKLARCSFEGAPPRLPERGSESDRHEDKVPDNRYPENRRVDRIRLERPHGPCLQTNRMDKSIRKFASLADIDQLKAEEYRFWQSRPVHERTDAVSELTQAHYAMKGAASDVPRLQRTLVRFERAPR